MQVSSEIIVGAILAGIIVVDVSLPPAVQGLVSSTPGIVVMLGLVFYLFSKNPIVGLLAAIACFMLAKKSPVFNPSRLALPVLRDSESQAGYVPKVGETLEEQMIQKKVPLVR
jgi:hypothetical protein